MRALLKPVKRWLVLSHRWLGIVTGLFFAVWFLSGLVMMYVGFPALTEAERLSRLAPIAWDRVSVGLDAALARAGLSAPRGLSLTMRGGKPVYQVVAEDGARIVLSARDGGRLGPATAAEAIATVAEAAPCPLAPQERNPRSGPCASGSATSARTVARDQWTVTARYDPLRPFHVVSLADAAGTELYVSQVTGAVVLDTTRHERVWNWLGAIPHWIYLTPLRAKADLWRDVILWVSGIGIAGAASGLVLGIWRLRLRRPYASGAVTPYRGMSRLHHLFGVVGGVSLLGFVASGWLSVNPNRWFSSPSPPPAMQAAYEGDAPAIGLDALRRLAGPGIVAVEATSVGGQTVAVAVDAEGRRTVAGAPAESDILAAARRLLPDARLIEAATLNGYDAYWYPHHDVRPLPVLRLVFDDPAATWLHIDPATGALLNRLDRSGRIHRWLFNGLHRLDLAWLTQNRPAWDIVLWSLTALGAVVALTGVAMGWRRLGRKRFRPPRPAIRRASAEPRRS